MCSLSVFCNLESEHCLGCELQQDITFQVLKPGKLINFHEELHEIAAKKNFEGESRAIDEKTRIRQPHATVSLSYFYPPWSKYCS